MHERRLRGAVEQPGRNRTETGGQTGRNRVFVLVLGGGEHLLPDQILSGRATSLLRRQTASWDDGEALNYLVE